MVRPELLHPRGRQKQGVIRKVCDPVNLAPAVFGFRAESRFKSSGFSLVYTANPASHESDKLAALAGTGEK